MVDRTHPEPVRLHWQLDGLADPPGLPSGVVAMFGLLGSDGPDAGRWLEHATSAVDPAAWNMWGSEARTAVRRLFTLAAVTGLPGDLGRRWPSAWRRARVCEALAEADPHLDAHDAFVGGFLAGVGHMALAWLRPKTWQRLQSRPPLLDGPVLDFDPGMRPESIGRRLVLQWGLGQNVADAVGDGSGVLGPWLSAVLRFGGRRRYATDDSIDETMLRRIREAIEKTSQPPPLPMDRAQALRILSMANTFWRPSDRPPVGQDDDPLSRFCRGPLPRARLEALRRVARSAWELGECDGIGFYSSSWGAAPWVWFDHRLQPTFPSPPSMGSIPVDGPVEAPLMQWAPHWASGLPERVDPGHLWIRRLDRRPDGVCLVSPRLALPDAVFETWRLLLAVGEQVASSQARADRQADEMQKQRASQRQRMEQAVTGRILSVTAGAAHELNNPLMVISGRAQMLGAKLSQDHPARSDADRIHEAAQSLSDMITQVHELAEPYVVRRANHPVRSLLVEAMQRVSEKGVSSVRVIGHLPSETVRTDKHAIASALSELLLNAHQADPKTIPRVNTLVSQANGRFLVVRVSDSGPGLSGRVLNQAFDPYFSAREAGRGAGLGLARAKRWVEALGGRIALANRRGGGAVATIAVPLEEECGFGRAERNSPGGDVASAAEA